MSWFPVKKKARFKVKKTASGSQYYFTFSAPNGEIVFSSETYVQKQSALHAIKSIKKHMSGSLVIDETGE